MSNSSIWTIDRTLSNAIIPSQSSPGTNGNEGVLYIIISSRTSFSFIFRAAAGLQNLLYDGFTVWQVHFFLNHQKVWYSGRDSIICLYFKITKDLVDPFFSLTWFNFQLHFRVLTILHHIFTQLLEGYKVPVICVLFFSASFGWYSFIHVDSTFLRRWANLQSVIIFFCQAPLQLVYSFESFSQQHYLIVYHWSLRDSKPPQVSRTLFSILTDLNNVVVWIVSTRLHISKSTSSCTNPWVTVPSWPITIDITVTFIYHCFFFSVL